MHIEYKVGRNGNQKNKTSELWELLLCFLTQRRFSDSVLLHHTTKLNTYANIYT